MRCPFIGGNAVYDLYALYDCHLRMYSAIVIDVLCHMNRDVISNVCIY